MKTQEILDNEEAVEVEEEILDVDDHGGKTARVIYQLDDKHYAVVYTRLPEWGNEYEEDAVEVVPEIVEAVEWVQVNGSNSPNNQAR